MKNKERQAAKDRLILHKEEDWFARGGRQALRAIGSARGNEGKAAMMRKRRNRGDAGEFDVDEAREVGESDVSGFLEAEEEEEDDDEQEQEPEQVNGGKEIEPEPQIRKAKEGGKESTHESFGALFVSAIALFVAIAYEAQKAFVKQGFPLVGAFGGFLGPVGAIFALDYAKRIGYHNYVEVMIFACASFAAVSGYFPFLGLIALNISGAYLDGLLILLSNATEGEEAKRMLENFRGTFLGVWTSFSGMMTTFAVALVQERAIPVAATYLPMTLVGSLVAFELGLRTGSYLVYHYKGAVQDAVQAVSPYLPILSSYVASHVLLSFPSPGIIFGYLFSTLGCFWGNLFDSETVLGPFLCNLIACVLAIGTISFCSLSPVVCIKAPALFGEFAGSFAGAGSAFCSSIEVLHEFLVSALQSDIREDWYFGNDFALAENYPVLGNHHHNQETLGKKSIAKLGYRIFGDLSLAAVVTAPLIAIDRL